MFKMLLKKNILNIFMDGLSFKTSSHTNCTHVHAIFHFTTNLRSQAKTMVANENKSFSKVPNSVLTNNLLLILMNECLKLLLKIINYEFEEFQTVIKIFFNTYVSPFIKIRN